jgi:hypothetical protein
VSPTQNGRTRNIQALSERDAAEYLAPHIIEGTYTGRFPDFGGAKVMRIEDLAKDWLAAQGIAKTIRPTTDDRNDMGLFNEGFVKAYNTNPEHCVDGIAWKDYLKARYGS